MYLLKAHEDQMHSMEEKIERGGGSPNPNPNPNPNWRRRSREAEEALTLTLTLTLIGGEDRERRRECGNSW